MPLTRRQVLTRAIGASGALALSRLLPVARASSATPTDPDRRFVFVYFLGGWDAITSLDPKDPEVYDDSADTVYETGVQTGYSDLGFTEDPRIFTSLEDMVFGPFVGERLAAFAPQIALLRGMTVSSVAHVPATTHALTGKDPAGELPRGSSIASILAGALGADDLIPNLASGVESWNLGGPDYASALAAANGSDLRKLLQPGFVALEPAERSALDDFFAAEAERVANPRLRSILGRRESSRMLIEREVAGLFDETNPDLADIVAHFDGQPRAFLAYQALTSGTSRCVSYEAHRFNDTHSGPDWRANHGYRLLSGFQSVAMLAEMLQATPHPAGGSWLDHTTIVCASEFNRSPALNATGGRDHATTNSMLLLGGGIRGGTLIGETHPIRMAGQAVDLETGAVDESGTQIEHGHVARSLLHSIGITEDIADFRVPHIPALLS